LKFKVVISVKIVIRLSEISLIFPRRL
jgi:hypothetical protein